MKEHMYLLMGAIWWWNCEPDNTFCVDDFVIFLISLAIGSPLEENLSGTVDNC